MKKISGVNTPVKGGMAVLKPFDIRAHSPDGYVFTRWLATLPLWTPLIIFSPETFFDNAQDPRTQEFLGQIL